MKTPARFLTSILLAVGIFFAGYLANRQKDPTTSAAAGEQTAKYACPMHPQYRSDRPTDCPICGMRLEPISSASDAATARSDIPGTVHVNTAKQQDVDTKSPDTRKAQYKGQTYYFCCDSCKKSFQANPDKFVNLKATSARSAKVKDPVCGMDVDPKSAGIQKAQYKGETYYFCCDSCKKSFQADPEKYLHKKTTAAKAAPAKDPVCGMNVDPAKAGALKAQYKGKTYYFCAEMCKTRFEANPEQYVRKMAETDTHGMHMTE